MTGEQCHSLQISQANLESYPRSQTCNLFRLGEYKVANNLRIILFRRTLTQNTLFPDLTYGEQNVRLSAELKPA